MGSTFLVLTAWRVMFYGLLFFGGIYLLFGGVNWLLTKWLLPTLDIGRPLDPRPLGAGQLQRELLQSGLSILLYGLGMIFPWGLLQLGWARLALDAGWQRIPIEIAVLMIWNDVHFYANHRALHSRWLKRFHVPHHRSVVTTPFSTYSFHPIEALMLGNVLLLPMLVHNFSFEALLAVPMLSLLFNNIGHANYDFFPSAGPDSWFAASRRHHLHHACYRGNFGFQFSFMDRLLGTRLAADAAAPHVAAALSTGNRCAYE